MRRASAAAALLRVMSSSITVSLPKNWPPLGPKAFLDRLRDGYILTANEMQQLKTDAERAQQLELEDPAFAQAVRRYRVLEAEEVAVEEMRRKLAEKAALNERARERVHRQRGANRERKHVLLAHQPMHYASCRLGQDREGKGGKLW